MSNLQKLKTELKKLADPKQAEILQSFFKTGPGEYGEGDVFLGIKVPVQRNVAKNYIGLSLDNLQQLLNSKIHEQRLIALFVLIDQYQNNKNRKELVNFYLANTKNINNWDLVDLSAYKILGNYLLERPQNILYKLAQSKSLWEKRIAIVSTFAFIRENQFEDTLKIAKILLNDEHDLIHKAVGWMLREVGKRNEPVEERFLKKHYQKMPRTMLRYAIEKFEEKKRQEYLKK